MLLFCAIVAPELVSRDLRSGVLPLYFSRPLRPADYALAKLAALVSAVTLLFAAGQIIMFLGAAFTLDGFGLIWDELREAARRHPVLGDPRAGLRLARAADRVADRSAGRSRPARSSARS